MTTIQDDGRFSGAPLLASTCAISQSGGAPMRFSISIADAIRNARNLR